MSEISRDEVVWAYRMILGRNPESETAIERKQELPNRGALRQTLLRSPEFAEKNKAVFEAAVRKKGAEGGPRPDEEKIIFLHVPRCAGTTIRKYMVEQLSEARMCPERFADLAGWSARALASYNLFAGHFDFLSAQLIPGGVKRYVTALRSPVARLRSFYYFTRSHLPDLPEHRGDPLIQLANALDFPDFLRAPEISRTIAIHNPYVRTFLDRRSLAGPIEQLTDPQKTRLMERDPERCIEVAHANLRKLDLVLFVDELDAKPGDLDAVLGVSGGGSFGCEQRRVKTPTERATLRPVPRQPEPNEVRDLMDECTALDRVLYERLRDPAR